MAANSVLKTNSMVITYIVGEDGKGNDIVRSQRVKELSVEATDENIVTLADGIEKLIVKPVKEIRKEQTFIITKGE